MLRVTCPLRCHAIFCIEILHQVHQSPCIDFIAYQLDEITTFIVFNRETNNGQFIESRA